MGKEGRANNGTNRAALAETPMVAAKCRVANPSEQKNAPYLVKKCPKWGFYYIRASEKMPDTQKWGIFSKFYCIFINKGKCPMVEKMPFFPKKALKMPGWQH